MYAIKISINGRKIVLHDADAIVRCAAHRTTGKRASMWQKTDKVFVITNAL